MNPQQKAWATRRIERAISIRHPWAELIIRGIKVRDFRSVPTKIRERVYVYASQRAEPENKYLEFGLSRGDLPTGLLIGTVEVIDCEKLGDRNFAYVLANPRRLTCPVKPVNHPQPVWFRPFNQC
jgi:hypothetical protein